MLNSYDVASFMFCLVFDFAFRIRLHSITGCFAFGYFGVAESCCFCLLVAYGLVLCLCVLGLSWTG